MVLLWYCELFIPQGRRNWLSFIWEGNVDFRFQYMRYFYGLMTFGSVNSNCEWPKWMQNVRIDLEDISVELEVKCYGLK